MKRGIRSVFRKIGPKHAQRHVDEFTGGLNVRDRDTIVHMAALARRMGSRHLPLPAAHRRQRTQEPREGDGSEGCFV